MRLADEEQSLELGHALGRQLQPRDAIAFFGELGAGKTTVARGVLRGLGFDGDVASPTFPIVQAYDPPDTRLAVWHVDLYRIEDPSELVELALDEAREAAALLVEWPERLGERLWPDALILRLSVAGAGARVLTASVPPAWEGRWPPPR